MIVEAEVTIRASRAAIWTAITDIEGAPSFLSGIERIEILEKPSHGLVGLRWRETRILFGKPATVDKWITDVVENEFYSTRAEDGGFVFRTTKRLSQGGDGVILSERHESTPRGIVATMMSIPMRMFFRGVIRRAVLRDLDDVKAAAERSGTPR